LEEKLALSHTANAPQSIMTALYMLGCVAYWEKNYQSAIRFCRESLLINEQIDDKIYLALTLEGSGCIAHGLDDLEAAGHLFGAVTKLRDTFGLPYDNSSPFSIMDQLIADGRDKRPKEWDTWWEIGQAMTIEELISYVRSHFTQYEGRINSFA